MHVGESYCAKVPPLFCHHAIPIVMSIISAPLFYHHASLSVFNVMSISLLRLSSIMLCFPLHGWLFSEKTVLHSQLSQMNIIILVSVLCSGPHSNSSRSEAGAPAVNASMAAILWHTTAYCGCQTFFGQSSSCHSLAFPLVSCPGLRAPSGLSMQI